MKKDKPSDEQIAALELIRKGIPLKDLIPFGSRHDPSVTMRQYCNLSKSPWILPTELLIPFIIHAMKSCPKIALAVYLQFFGGLRLSELLNLRVDDFDPFKDNTWPSVRVKLSKNPGTENIQPVIYVKGLLERIYENHLELIGSSNGENLFINHKGVKMSADSYNREFQMFLTTFIDFLDTSDNPSWKSYAEILRQSKCASSFGRITFMKMLADQNVSPAQMALAGRAVIHLSEIPFEKNFDYSFYSSISNMFSQIYESFDLNNTENQD